MNSRIFENSYIKGMVVCCANDNAHHERLPRESDLTLSRAISAGYTAEETPIYAHEILQLKSTTDSLKTNTLHKPRLDEVRKSK